MIRRWAIAAVMLVAACGQQEDPAPPPPTGAESTPSPPTPATSTTSSSSQSRPSVAPKPSRTLDMRKYTTQACDALTQQQVASLELSSYQVLRATNLCRWSLDGGKTTFDLSFNTVMDVLQLYYDEADKPYWVVFEAITVGGFPGVKRQGDSKPPVYNCQVFVATGPKQGIEVRAVSTGVAADWCGKAVKAAEFVVGNLGT
ncbi:DUF3558 domain-containing protein [Actinocrispum sp. NPDC049592]|uniref:DUF3558 domain-containing protein n=1 Tax=Actinocrispum sp. NPDC049592 TaxID=3154835 RepID=UPI00342C5A7F